MVPLGQLAAAAAPLFSLTGWQLVSTISIGGLQEPAASSKNWIVSDPAAGRGYRGPVRTRKREGGASSSR